MFWILDGRIFHLPFERILPLIVIEPHCSEIFTLVSGLEVNGTCIRGTQG